MTDVEALALGLAAYAGVILIIALIGACEKISVNTDLL